MKLKTSKIAELTNLTPGAVRYLRAKMPTELYEKKSSRQWLFDRRAIEWILTRKPDRPGKKPKK